MKIPFDIVNEIFVDDNDYIVIIMKSENTDNEREKVTRTIGVSNEYSVIVEGGYVVIY